MAETDNMEEEDLFADLYDNDDSAPSKDQIPAAPSAPEPVKSDSAPGYGEEPDTGHDPTSFEMDAAMHDQPTNGASDMGFDGAATKKDVEPGIQMKEDG
ncbi:uncharacterized protein HMPREF1541_05381 [Cyphellophora europaea CBS 101466]|uniref:Uncharacterized protein n=1 Tax=Cyphellophora europaea (strain CBS 101466) TaxID=1220924 RepID=W2RTS5_CYPE1|nr:uncharacterized protein HMPREF1541_05381 [Cyphellophora europaea CBS 101466]ETN39158.1 hypothetical protein HMPREF1541_05381 [Cyphellophora europaea CBS 101466]